MDERNNDFDFDFMPIGQAIKKAREARGMTREQLSGIIGYAPRHIQSIETRGNIQASSCLSNLFKCLMSRLMNIYFLIKKSKEFRPQTLRCTARQFR